VILFTFLGDIRHRGFLVIRVILSRFYQHKINMHTPSAASRLTNQSLAVLKELGFQYVLVEGYTPDRRNDYVELNHFTLVPVKELPEEPGQSGIFAPIDSDIIREWASQPDNGIKAFIEGYPDRFRR
jgi:hypothetical protein